MPIHSAFWSLVYGKSKRIKSFIELVSKKEMIINAKYAKKEEDYSTQNAAVQKYMLCAPFCKATLYIQKKVERNISGFLAVATNRLKGEYNLRESSSLTLQKSFTREQMRWSTSFSLNSDIVVFFVFTLQPPFNHTTLFSRKIIRLTLKSLIYIFI